MIPHLNESKQEWNEEESKYQYIPPINVKWYDRILLNRPLKVGLSFLLVAVIAPVLVYRFYFFTSLNLPPSDGYSAGSCLIPRDTRLPCGTGLMTEEQCHPQCCFDRHLHMCFHRIPSRFSYIMAETWNENTTMIPRISTVPYSFQNSFVNSIPSVRLSIDEKSARHMSMTFYNSNNLSLVGEKIYDKEYSYSVSSPELNVVVEALQGTIFTTARGPLIASDNIWEIAFTLTNESLYGLGELPLKGNTTKIIYSHENGFSSVPLIYAKLNGSFHGLLIDVKDPTEIIIRPDYHIIVRSITNFGLKLHLFSGPEPKSIMQEVKKLIGYNEQLEYWMLGIHVCNEVPNIDLATFIANATSERMPYDSHCGHAPIVFNSDQCSDSEVSNADTVNAGATLVINARKKFVPHVSPYLRYIYKEFNETIIDDVNENETTEEPEIINSCNIIPTFEDIIFRSENHSMYKGIIDDYEVLYPSYEGEQSDKLMDNLWVYSTALNAVVLENSWPLNLKNYTNNDTASYLPYFNDNFEKAFIHTPQWNLSIENSSDLYLFKHNEYGNNFANALVNKLNTPIISSSLWMNGLFAINRQNIDVSWTNLRREIIGAAIGGISGSWLWSSPICGDTENFDLETQASLCVKWYLAGTYFPMIKIHSKEIPRYPVAFGGTHKAIVINALNRRLGLLPYYYTVLQEGPLIRPMFFQFPSSSSLHDINTQFSVGDDLLIAPNLQPFQTHVHVWLPPGDWYELWSGLKLIGEEGDPVTMTTTEADFLTFIRGGSILTYQKDTQFLTAEETRFYTPLSLIIALECKKNNETEICQASGKLYVSPNMTLLFKSNERNLTITSEGNDFDPICNRTSGTLVNILQFLSIYGLAEELNNFDYHREFRQAVNLCQLQNDSEIVVNLIS